MTEETPKPEATDVAPAATTDAAPAEAAADDSAQAEAEVAATAPVQADATPETADPTADPTADAPAEATAELSPAATGARLAELFPALFAPPARPIKLRIQADIQQRAPGVFTKKGLSLFLHRHTTSTAYLRALVTSPTRFDLDGQPAGEVADEHRDAAKLEVERRRAIVEARRTAERDALRQRHREQAREQPREPGRGPARDRPPARGPQADGAPARPEHRPERPPQGPRPDRPPRPERTDRPPRPERPARVEPLERAAAPAVEPAVRDADHEARRERAALLRAYETSTLTRANFCVLKRITETDLEAALAVARKEREDRPPMPPRHDGPARPQGEHAAGPRPQGERHPGPRRDDRGARPPGRGRPRAPAPR